MTYLVRAAPTAKAVLLMGLMSPTMACSAIWNTKLLGAAYCGANPVLVTKVISTIAKGGIKSVDDLLLSVQQRMGQTLETLPKVAAPVAAAPRRQRSPPVCTFCKKTGHAEKDCWNKFPDKMPEHIRRRTSSNSNGAASEYLVLAEGRDVFVVNATINGAPTKMGIDSMAALNLIRNDAVPTGVAMSAGGPSLHGVGHSQARGTVKLAVKLGAATFDDVVFAVVEELPVAALLGKPTLAQMKAMLDIAGDSAIVVHNGAKIELQVVALPVGTDSKRPESQSYWNWLNKRFAAAPRRLQTVFQDVVERTEDETLELFFASFPDWCVDQRQKSGQDDALAHPAPYLQHLRRPVTVATGMVVCPMLVHASDILGKQTEHSLVPKGDDNRDFLPPIMSFAEEDRQVDEQLARIVREAELTPGGKIQLKEMLNKYRKAFGMQLRKVNTSQDKVHTHTTGALPEHQARRPIRDLKVQNAQIEWEDEMLKRGVIGELSCANPELARPINIHHVIRNKKIRFTADARTLNEVTLQDSFPVPSPLEALERF